VTCKIALILLRFLHPFLLELLLPLLLFVLLLKTVEKIQDL
jgi:hypothetical protein